MRKIILLVIIFITISNSKWCCQEGTRADVETRELSISEIYREEFNWGNSEERYAALDRWKNI